MATDPANTDPSMQSDTRLRGGWLVIARATWVVLFALSLALLGVGTPIIYDIARHQPELMTSGLQIAASADLFIWSFMALCTIPLPVLALTAVILFWLRSDDWMAMFVSLTPLMFWTSISPNLFYLPTAQPAWQGPASFISVVGLLSVFLLFCLFPNGRFVPRWTRIPAATAGVLALATLILSASRQFSRLLDLTPVLWLGFVASGVFAQIYRFVRISTPVERQQTKWPLLSLLSTVVMLVAMVVLLTTGRPNAPMTLGGMAVFVLALLFIPVSLGISILRYRLWDVDFFINRSLVYGTLTVLLVALFGLSTFVVSRTFQGFEGGSIVAVAVSAAAFGAIFKPARRRLQRFIDRRFYGIQIDYQKTPLPVAASGQMSNVLQQAHFGVYQNLELIGHGGMAKVYRAVHPTLGHSVAIKLLPAHLATDPEFQHRFQREAQVVSSLEHPHIVRVFGFGEESGVHYMVMEYLAGEDLEHYLREAGRLSLVQAAPILQDIANALDYAHAQGLVHRDIKPSNVMLDRSDPGSARNIDVRAVLMDFGIAKIVGGHTMLTRDGVLGTLDYIAPEQIQASAEIDGRADVYALGVMVYQMLTGKLPFKHDNPGALLIAHLTQPPPNPREQVPELSRQVSRALQRAMAKGPMERYPTAGEFVQALLV
jgi:hypothetical protein